MSANLIVIVPSRGRPQSVARVAAAWSETDAWADGAELLFAVDRDDDWHEEYHVEVQRAAREYGESVTAQVLPTWLPMVRKLDEVSVALARGGFAHALGFAGDDHLPRTAGWVADYMRALYDFGSGFVSCPDGYRPDDLPTQWAVTADIVKALGRMVPAPVGHLYCDDSIRDVAKGAGVYAYLPDVFIEHMHPVAGKAVTDEQYDRVNGSVQRRSDKRAYRAWRDGGGMDADVRAVRDLLSKGETE